MIENLEDETYQLRNKQEGYANIVLTSYGSC